MDDLILFLVEGIVYESYYHDDRDDHDELASEKVVHRLVKAENEIIALSKFKQNFEDNSQKYEVKFSVEIIDISRVIE